MNVGNSWAILQRRRHGDKEKAAAYLNSMSPAKRKEQNRQDAQAKGSSKKPYRLGERLRIRKIRIP